MSRKSVCCLPTKILVEISAVVQIAFSTGLLVYPSPTYVLRAKLSEIEGVRYNLNAIQENVLWIVSFISSILFVLIVVGGITLGVILLLEIRKENSKRFYTWFLWTFCIAFFTFVLFMQELSLSAIKSQGWGIAFAIGFVINMCIITVVNIHEKAIQEKSVEESEKYKPESQLCLVKNEKV